MDSRLEAYPAVEPNTQLTEKNTREWSACACLPIARMSVSVGIEVKGRERRWKEHSQVPVAPKTPSRPILHKITILSVCIWKRCPLRNRLQPLLRQLYLRWISLGNTKEKLWPGNQNYTKEAAHWHSVNSDHSMYSQRCLHPENVCLREKGSLRNIAPVKPVRIGVRYVNMVDSDNDKCSMDIYIPARPTKLNRLWGIIIWPNKITYPEDPRSSNNPRTPFGPSSGSGIFCQSLIIIRKLTLKAHNQKDAHIYPTAPI